MSGTEGVLAWLAWPYGAIVGAGFLLIIIALHMLVIGYFKSLEGGKSAKHVGLVSGQQEASSEPAAIPAKALRSEKQIAEDILLAEKRGDVTALAALYLEQARVQLHLGTYSSAADILRKSVVLAAKHDLKKIHADARLELAVLAEESGDLTTACEHWQIARTLFHELDLQADVDKTDKRMLGNGCPTDWVLTDF